MVLALIAGVIIGRYLYMKPGFVNGEMAVDFAISDTQNLSDLQGNYVLLDFWGSWCGPCRKENPTLVEFYKNYHERGLEIVSVAVEEKEERWRRARQKDGLIWPHHVFDQATSLSFFDSPVATKYSVKSIPTKYLLDDKGMIIAVNPSWENLEKLLNDRLPK